MTSTLTQFADRVRRLEAALEAVETIVGSHGCDCECDHHHEEHDDDCERCLACRISLAIEAAKGGE